MIKTLLKCVREYKKPSILSSFFMVFEVSFECLVPFLMSKLIDNMKTDDLKMVFILLASVLICAALGLLSGFLSGKYAAIASSGFAKNLRHDMFEKIQDYSFENIDNFSSSSLVTRMTTDVNNIQMTYGMIIRTCIRSPLMLVVSITMTFIINPQIAT